MVVDARDGDQLAAAYLMRYGRPITYGYLDGEFPIADYQTV